MEKMLWERLTNDNFIESHILADRIVYDFHGLTIYVREDVTKVGYPEDGKWCALIPVNKELARQIKKKLQGYI